LLQCNKEMYAKEWGSTTNGSTAATCVTRVVGRNIHQHARGYCKRHEKAHEFYLRRISDARKLLISPNDGYSHGWRLVQNELAGQTSKANHLHIYVNYGNNGRRPYLVNCDTAATIILRCWNIWKKAKTTLELLKNKTTKMNKKELQNLVHANTCLFIINIFIII
jgi:hypothetical protein